MDVNCGTYATFAITSDDHIFAFGLNNYGQLALPGGPAWSRHRLFGLIPSPGMLSINASNGTGMTQAAMEDSGCHGAAHPMWLPSTLCVLMGLTAQCSQQCLDLTA